MLIEEREKFEKEFQQAVSRMDHGYIVAMMTDELDIQRIDCENFSRDKLFYNALEIRMFNENSEEKWYRSSIDKAFHYRVLKDDKKKYWDETQYLDIDENRSKMLEPGMVYATGGGKYPLPINDYKNAQVLVRNYLDYEEDTMQLYISDWRLVDFGSEEELDKKYGQKYKI